MAVCYDTHVSELLTFNFLFTSFSDHCAAATCSNGGSCANTGVGFECTCTTGWVGDTCEAIGEKSLLMIFVICC